MWTERLSIICGPANALERVARFVVRYAHDLREAQGASGGAEQEMLRHGVQSLVGDGPASLPWKSSANSTIFRATIATTGSNPGVVI